MKLITNLVLGLKRAALAEGLAFAEAVGVAPAAALEVMAGSMAYSRAMDAKGRNMIEHDFTVQARLSQHLKDVRMMLQAVGEAGLLLPLADTHRRLMEQAEAPVWAAWTTAPSSKSCAEQPKHSMVQVKTPHDRVRLAPQEYDEQ
jgi:3-hydroxyisobutyrate dehydrogenase-like beta-hydroxyacid dehydrogenase